MLVESKVRAPLTKAIVEMLDRQPGVAAGVRARVPNEVRRVEECSRVDWVPLATQLAILDALKDEVGLRRWEEFVRAHFSSTVEQPFVKGMFESAVRLFGMGPGAVFRVFAKTWATISKGCGEVEIGEVDPKGTLIRVRELPVDQARIELFVAGFRSTFQGALDVFKSAGDVELVSFDRAARTSVYRARWA
jgi:hypothetical protein